MFKGWLEEKATKALIDEADALFEKLRDGKRHVVDNHAAAAMFWAAVYGEKGRDLYAMSGWPAKEVASFAREAGTRIKDLRKGRDYDSADGLTIWLHTARGIIEPQVAPSARSIWVALARATSDAVSMADEMVADAGLAGPCLLRAPAGFAPED
ncbi:MAG: hypothetical protein V4804_05655 [Pseudomonadota bacterium]